MLKSNTIALSQNNSSPSLPANNSLNVLLVEDNHQIRKSLEYRLTSLGINVIILNDIFEINDIVERYDIDAVYIDLDKSNARSHKILTTLKTYDPDIVPLSSTSTSLIKTNKDNIVSPNSFNSLSSPVNVENNFATLDPQTQLHLLASTEIHLRLLQSSLDDQDICIAKIALSALEKTPVLLQFAPIFEQVVDAAKNVKKNHHYPVPVIHEIVEFTLSNFEAFTGPLNEEPFVSNLKNIRSKMRLMQPV